MQASTLAGWVERVKWQKKARLTALRAGHRLTCKSKCMAMDAWVEAVLEAKFEEEMQTKEDVMKQNCELNNENGRLRRDNERFVRLIDSGEWGRNRVEELSQVQILF